MTPLKSHRRLLKAIHRPRICGFPHIPSLFHSPGLFAGCIRLLALINDCQSFSPAFMGLFQAWA